MFDKTFCVNGECTLKAKCDRHYDRIKELKKRKPHMWIRPLSISNFEPKISPKGIAVSCNVFIERDGE